jgi:hypothetical protein
MLWRTSADGRLRRNAAMFKQLIVGTPPAMRAMRLNIVDALADKR